MELLKGYESTVKFVAPKSLTTATFKVRKGADILNQGTATASNGLVEVNIPWSVVNKAGRYSILVEYTHNGGQYGDTRWFDVVNPILELHEINEVLEDGDEKEYREVERAVRHIINAHCGQEFGLVENEERLARGDGSTSLVLPARAVRIYRLPVAFSSYELKDDGWRLQASLYDYDTSRFHVYMPKGVIRRPDVDPKLYFRDDANVWLTADWGWEYVPEPVREAARLLVNDYSCGDAVYRDRFLTSMTAADWRIQFHAGAFADTGNVRANQLLQDYVVLGGWLAV